jgi:hypothetical protein
MYLLTLHYLCLLYRVVIVQVSISGGGAIFIIDGTLLLKFFSIIVLLPTDFLCRLLMPSFISDFPVRVGF